MADDEDPLRDEAKARGKWRDGATIVAKGGKSASLPASEVDDAAAGHSDDVDEGRPGRAPGNIPPPD